GYGITQLRSLNQIILKYDIIHSHDLGPMMYLMPLKIFHGRKFPKLFHTTHGLSHLERKGRYFIYEKALAYMADAVIAVSEEVAHFYLNKVKINQKKLHQILNGIQVPSHPLLPGSPEKKQARQKLIEKYHLPTNKIFWLFLARIVPPKDPQTLSEALEFLPQAHLLMVGPAQDFAYTENLKKIGRDGGKDNVSFLGDQPITEIVTFLQGADFFLSASHFEGIPLSVLEAMACGLPCLLSDIPSHRQLARGDNPSATLFAIQRPKELAEAYRQLQHDPDQQLKLSQNAYNLVDKFFNVKRMSQEYSQVYACHFKRL
ncbi:MAG: glycosyltransferase family 4 protein, partial [Pseudomonadota bacterium]